MKEHPENGQPILNIVGERIALGPPRRDLLPLYQRWMNDFGTIRTIGFPPGPVTAEKEQDWYERRARAEDKDLSPSTSGRRCSPSGTRGFTAWMTQKSRVRKLVEHLGT